MSRKTVFITGAAAGIGRAIAEHFANEGWYVGAFDIDTQGVLALQDTLGVTRCYAGVLDVTNRDAWDGALAGFIEAAGQPLNVLINNAGVLDSGPFQDISARSHRRIIDINVMGVINGCHAAFSALAGPQEACIINMASASAIYGQPALASYSASKFAVRGLTEGLNIEWQPHGIRVVDIWPLFVQTNMVKDMKADSIDRMGVKLTPQDVAKTILQAAQAGAKNGRVHWPVGFEVSGFALLTRLMPSALSRFMVKRLAG
jgi:NAD(P)-dependent dehydrogenase (short-subunit alcohol dehydrogenase family)